MTIFGLVPGQETGIKQVKMGIAGLSHSHVLPLPENVLDYKT